MRRFMLKRQLNTLAQSPAEAAQLARLARAIGDVELPRLSPGSKAAIAHDIGFGYHPHHKAFIRSWEGALTILVVMVLTFAQSARPGSALYSVKKGTDKVRTALIQNIPLLDRADDTLQHENNTKGDTTPGGRDGSTDGSSGRAGADSGSGSDTSGSRHPSGDTSGGSGTTGSGDSSGSGSPLPSSGSGSGGGPGSGGSGTTGSGSGSGRDSSGSGKDIAPTDSF